MSLKFVPEAVPERNNTYVIVWSFSSPVTSWQLWKQRWKVNYIPHKLIVKFGIKLRGETQISRRLNSSTTCLCCGSRLMGSVFASRLISAEIASYLQSSHVGAEEE